MRGDHIVTGRVTQNGLVLDQRAEFEAWQMGIVGSRVIGKFDVIKPKSAELLGYYWKKVVPDMAEALRGKGYLLPYKDAERYIRQFAPTALVDEYDESTGEYARRVRSVKEMSNIEFHRYIEELKIFAAIELHYFIIDPQTIKQ
jgi:hypothetical protein